MNPFFLFLIFLSTLSSAFADTNTWSTSVRLNLNASSVGEDVGDLIRSHMRTSLRGLSGVTIDNENGVYVMSVIVLPLGPKGYTNGYAFSYILARPIPDLDYEHHFTKLTIEESSVLKGIYHNAIQFEYHGMITTSTSGLRDTIEKMIAVIDSRIFEPQRQFRLEMQKWESEQKSKPSKDTQTK